jgi:3-phenylpropionate/trans-cinnamate dioxygenase ferredoxin component
MSTTMGIFTKALPLRELGSGTKKTIVVTGKKIAVANIDGKIFAVDDTCSHQQCSLGGEGFLDGTTLICGCHGAQFDITNGKVLSLPAPTDIVSYATQVKDGEIYIKL